MSSSSSSSRRGEQIDWPAEPPAWWRNGLGWVLFVVAPGCGLALGLAISQVFG